MTAVERSMAVRCTDRVCRCFIAHVSSTTIMRFLSTQCNDLNSSKSGEVLVCAVACSIFLHIVIHIPTAVTLYTVARFFQNHKILCHKNKLCSVDSQCML